MTSWELIIEIIGWISTATFLISILHPNRLRLHELGMFTSVTTGIYAYAHGATAIWVKWVIAFFFHLFMRYKLQTRTPRENLSSGSNGSSNIEKN